MIQEVTKFISGAKKSYVHCPLLTIYTPLEEQYVSGIWTNTGVERDEIGQNNVRIYDISQEIGI